MAKVSPPPINDPVADEEAIATLPWVLFFNQLFTGDTGTEWTPTWQNLTEVGSPTYDALYYKIGSFVFFRVTITPDTSTSATAGSTYIDNFPLTFNGDGACWAVGGGVGDGPGHVVGGSSNIYVPAWSSVSIPLSVIGFAEGK